MKHSNVFWILCGAVLLTRCGEKKIHLPTAAMNQEMLNRKIVKINTAEINYHAICKAKATIDSLQIDTITEANFLTTNDVQIYYKTKNDFAVNSKLFKLYDAYIYNIENQLPLEGSLLTLDDTTMVYIHPKYEKTNKKLGLWCIYMRRKDIIMYIAAIKPDR